MLNVEFRNTNVVVVYRIGGSDGKLQVEIRKVHIGGNSALGMCLENERSGQFGARKAG